MTELHAMLQRKEILSQLHAGIDSSDEEDKHIDGILLHRRLFHVAMLEALSLSI